MSFPLISRVRDPRRAFTLIELLTVMAIIGILAGITFGVFRGVKERSSIQQARTELAALSTALENYKRQYGDYPQTGAINTAGVESSPALGSIDTNWSQAALFNALGGKIGPKLANFSNGKVFVELAKFRLETANLPVLTNDTTVDNAFLDPWGRRYVYAYRSATVPGTWTAPSFALFSAGPDGKVKSGDPTNTGAIDYADVDNIDNIYSNR